MASAQDKTTLRLKTVLDVLADQADADTTLPASRVLDEVISRVPLDGLENELLSGGAPRGYKRLSTASAKLVKAGWLVKGRSGWKITEEGLRAAADFPDTASFEGALTQGSPAPAPASAVEDPQPASVGIAGDFGSITGASEDWNPLLDEVQMILDPQARIWQLSVELPAGFYSYKVAIDRSWDENYGAFGVRDGANHELHLSSHAVVTFRYDHSTNDVATDVQADPNH